MARLAGQELVAWQLEVRSHKLEGTATAVSAASGKKSTATAAQNAWVDKIGHRARTATAVPANKSRYCGKRISTPKGTAMAEVCVPQEVRQLNQIKKVMD